MNVLKAVIPADDRPAAFPVNPRLQVGPTVVMQARQGVARQSPKRYLCPVPARGFSLNYRIYTITGYLSRSEKLEY